MEDTTKVEKQDGLDYVQAAKPNQQQHQTGRCPGADYSPWGSCPHLKNRRILLVDDDDGVRGVLRHILELGGCVVTEAADGLEALSRLNDGIELVITDEQMPGLRGSDLAHVIQQRKNGVAAAILITGSVSPETSRFAAVLKKPFDPVELLHVTRSVLMNADRQKNRARAGNY
jgi:two-component system, chemotaxis family, chemotaxis protein CheY